MQSQVQEILELAKARLAVVVIGFTAHFARVLALAPILAGLTMALMMANALTGLSERLEWLLDPVFRAVLPESLQGGFSGGLMEFGLPIAFKHVGLGFWICLILWIIKQFTGTEWRKRIFAFKYWAAGSGVYFLFIAVFLFFFHQVQGSFGDAS